MNGCFFALCILCFVSPCNILVKIVLGTLICILFSIVMKKSNIRKEFARVLIVACFIAINFVVMYVRSDYLCLKNGIGIALLLNCMMSVYILGVLLVVTRIRDIFRLK